MDRRWLGRRQRNKRRSRYTAHGLKEGPRICDAFIRAGIRGGTPLATAHPYPWDLIARSSTGRMVRRGIERSLWGTRRCRRKRRFTPIGVLLSLWLDVLPTIPGLGNKPGPIH